MGKLKIFLSLLPLFVVFPLTAFAADEFRNETRNEVTIKDDTFYLEGIVTGNNIPDSRTFAVGGVIIFVDHTTQTQGEGMLLPGREVKVEGVAIEDFLVAKEIHLK